MAKQAATSRNWNREANVYTYLDAPESQSFVASRIMALKPASILDIGSYRGALWGMLKEIGYKGTYTGIEIAGKPLAVALNRYGHFDARHEFIHADAFAIRLPPAELVNIGGVFWYLDGPAARAFMAKVWAETGCKWILVSDPERCKNELYKITGPGIEHGTFEMAVETRNSKRKYMLFDASAKEAIPI